MKNSVLLLTFLLTSIYLSAENNIKKIDSLNRIISNQTGRERIETLIYLSELYREASPEKSLQTDTMAIDYAKKEGLENMKGIVLVSMGKTASLSGDFPLALKYLNEAVVSLEQTGNHTDLCRAFVNIGLVYKNMADYENAIHFFNKATDLAKKMNLKDQLASAINNRASIYFSKGDYNNAAENYRQAMEAYKELNDSVRYAALTMNLGLVYWQWNKSDLALEMLLEAKEVFEKKKQYVELGKAYNNIGRIYYQDFKDTVKALEFYEKSLAMRELIGNQLGMSVVLANIGNIYRDKNVFPKAFDYFTRSLSISKAIGYKEGEALAYYYLGLAFKQNHKYKISNIYFDSCMTVAVQHNLKVYFNLINEGKMINYFNLQDYDSFLKEYKVFSSGYDSTRKVLAELEFKESTSVKRIGELETENEKLNQEIQNKSTAHRTFLAATVTLSIICIGLMVMLVRSRKRNGVK